MFEGPDAAGKGGTIRRLTTAMDARDYQVISVAAPTEEEHAHPYLWRKAAITTLVSAVIWAGIYALISSDLISFRGS